MALPENVAGNAAWPHDPDFAALSRRSMLRGAVGAGAAGLALTTLSAAPALAASRPADAYGAPEEGHVPDHIADGEAIVAHVRSVRSGEIDVYRGTTHIRVINHALAAQLAGASR